LKASFTSAQQYYVSKVWVAVIQWGRRVYYYNSHRDGGDFAWHKNNLNTAKNGVQPVDITASWVFKNKWHRKIYN
jgi:hypothetical protein